MAEQPLQLLKRVTDQAAVGDRIRVVTCPCISPKALLYQQCQHVNREGMPEVMGTHVQRNAGICATSIRPIKHNLPTVWRNGGADFTQPQGGRLLRQSLCVTEHQTSPLVWSQAIHWRVDPQPPTRQEHQPAMRDLSTQDVVLHLPQDIALTKLRYRCVALNRQIRLEPCQQPGGHSDRSPLIPFREPGTQQKR